MWYEKYRPKTFEEMALQDDHRRFLSACIEQRDMPHLIFVGPPGCGKTTAAVILEAALSEWPRVFDVSERSGIHVVRNEIARAIRLVPLQGRVGHKPFHIFRIEEAEGIKPDALRVLRGLMEKYPEHNRFIFTCNDLPSDKAIIDRCTVVQMDTTAIPTAEKLRVADRILAAEGVAAERGLLTQCVRLAPTMRSLIRHLEGSFREHGHLQPFPTRGRAGGGDQLSLVPNTM